MQFQEKKQNKNKPEQKKKKKKKNPNKTISKYLLLKSSRYAKKKNEKECISFIS